MFDEKDPMETFGFFATIRDELDDHNMSEALATCALGFFLSNAAQKAYHNVVHLGTQDPMRSSTSSQLVVHTLLSRFVKYDPLRKEHQAVMTSKVKPRETEIAL